MECKCKNEQESPAIADTRAMLALVSRGFEKKTKQRSLTCMYAVITTILSTANNA